MKKPQQAEPSIDSPCEANSIVNEFGDIELPNLNSNTITANSSSGFNINNMNWAAAASTLPSLSWPQSSLLNPNQLSMNYSWLLKALQLRNSTFQPREQYSAADFSSFMAPPQGISQFGTDLLSSNLQASSSNKTINVETMPQQQQQQQEQQFNLDSIW